MSWSTVAAAGLDSPHAIVISVASLTSVCPITWVAPSRANLYFPATPNTAGVGTSNAYLFVLEKDATPSEDLLVEVANGTATLEFYETPTSRCGETNIESAVPADVIDSPEVVTLATAAFGPALFADRPHAEVEWAVVGFLGTPEWLVEVVGGCDQEFEVLLNALDGAVEENYSFGQCYYSVNVTESGLPAGTTWGAVLSGGAAYTSNTSFEFTLPNGSYNVSVTEPGYTPAPAWATVTVLGANVSQAFVFSRISNARAVTFNESGLPTDRSWTVELFSSPGGEQNGTGTSLVMWLTPGTYSYYAEAGGYNASPAIGSLTVSTKDVWVDIAFTLYPHTLVSWVESGLPAGAPWTVDTTAKSGGGEGEEGPFANISMSLPDGQYTYTISTSERGYRPTSASGGFTATGRPITVDVEFEESPGFYTVAFVASGLPADSAFNVTIDGAVGVAVGSDTLDFELANATYPYTVPLVYGYSASPTSGNVTVDGGPATVPITFSAVPMYLVTFSETGLPTGTEWWVEFGNVSSLSYTAVDEFYGSDGAPPFFAYTSYSDYVATPAYGHLRVSGGPASQAVVFGPAPTYYVVKFTESGLPTGTLWSVTLGSQTNSTVGDANLFEDENGTYAFSVGSVADYAPGVGSGSLTVAGSDLSETVTFRPATTYAITFDARGLPTGDLWSVTLDGVRSTSAARSIEFNETNGSYAFSVATSVPYLPKPGDGTVPVSGAPVTRTVTFEEEFEVMFSESGLTTGARWTATLNGTARLGSAPAASFFEPNGTYAFAANASGYRAVPASGSVTVQGTLVIVSVSFAPHGVGAFPVTFTETGLPAGAVWWVVADGVNLTSTVATIPVFESNGTLDYTDGSFGYTASPSAGVLEVDGAAGAVSVAFSVILTGEYVVTFSESGLPAGTAWQVTLNGVTTGGAGTTVTFAEPSGTYAFRLSAVPGFAPVPASGSVTVAGKATELAVEFSAPVPAKSSGVLGLPGDDGWWLVGGIGLAVVVVAAVAVALRRPKAPPSSGPPPPSA